MEKWNILSPDVEEETVVNTEWTTYEPTGPEPKLSGVYKRKPKRGVYEIEEVLSQLDGLGVVCGGYARYMLSPNVNTPKAGDLDLYVYEPGFEKALTTRLLGTNLFVKIFETPRAITFRKRHGADWVGPDRLQIIKPVQEGRLLTYGTVEAILGNFDFSVARAAVDANKVGWVDENFDQDELDMNLRIEKIQCPISSTLRIAKYAGKGYKIISTEVFKLFEEWNRRGENWQVSIKKEFDEMRRLQEQLEKDASADNDLALKNHQTALYDRLSVD